MVLSIIPKPKISAKSALVVKKAVSPAFLKHAVQFDKLQQKAALETAAIDSIRNVLRQKALLEKDCALAIEKLLAHHASRKELREYFELFHTSETESSNSHGAPDCLTLAELWKNSIADIQRQQTLKINACEDVIKLTSPEDPKASKLSRAGQVKRGIDVILEVQREVDTVADRVTQAKKNYTDRETIVQETHKKIRKLDEKGRKSGKATRIPEKFTTLLSLEVPKATAARNEYILSIAGANAFLSQYYSHDLPYIIDMMNGNTYDVMASTLISVFETEHRVVSQTNQFLENLLSRIKKLNNKKDVTSFISAQPSLFDAVLYSFEPVDGDTISLITAISDPNMTMDKCARKWALRYVEGESAQKKLVQQLSVLASQTASGSLETTEGKAAMEAKLFTTHESLRRAATYQLQAKNILDALRQGKVDLDRWMESARQAMEQKILGSDGPEIISTLPPSTKRHQTASSTADSEKADNLSASGSSVTDGGAVVQRVRCVALYDYTADRADELSFVANQELFWLSGSTDDQWLLVEDVDGQQGYIPANYASVLAADLDPVYGTSKTGLMLADYSSGWNDSPSNGWDDPVGNSWENDEGYSYEPEVYAANSTTSSDMELYGVPSVGLEKNTATGFCRALFDYSAEDAEDLSFQEGDLIRVVSRTSTSGVDDGFWTGELHGRSGLFMVALTEEIQDSDKTSEMGTSVSSNASPQPSHGLPPVPNVPPRVLRHY